MVRAHNLSRAACSLALACGLISCASLPSGSSWRAELRAAVLARGVEPASLVVPFEVGEAGRDWVHREVPEVGGPVDRLETMLQRLTAADGLALVYENRFTGTADEVLEKRSANCLGFVNLFVALARELGLPAYFVAIDDRPLYDKEGDLVVISDHVAAGFGSGKEMRLLDFAVGPPRDYQSLRPLSDREALARYYANRGAELLRDGKVREAREWSEQAVRIAPEMASGWVNLGVARRRSGDLGGAELAYRQALEVDPKTLSAYQNLAAALRLRGREDEALQLLAVTDRATNRNPFSFLSLGDWNLEAGRVADARRLYRRAISLDRQAAEPVAALGLLELQAGSPAKARRWLKRAKGLDPSNVRTQALAGALAEVGS